MDYLLLIDPIDGEERTDGLETEPEKEPVDGLEKDPMDGLDNEGELNDLNEPENDDRGYLKDVPDVILGERVKLERLLERTTKDFWETVIGLKDTELFLRSTLLVVWRVVTLEVVILEG